MIVATSAADPNAAKRQGQRSTRTEDVDHTSPAIGTSKGDQSDRVRFVMSMDVPLDRLEAVANSLGPAAYVVVSDPGDPPRITHVRPEFAGSSIWLTLGRRSVALMEQQRRIALLWPATKQEEMSLIVDADVAEVTEAGRARVIATSAVRHRHAPRE